MMSMVTIIVPCRNEVKHVRTFLNSVYAQDFGNFAWEIIVADGASGDGTRAELEDIRRANPDTLRIIDNPGQIVSTGLNAAIRASRGDVIIRMDAHTEYAPDYVRQCLATLQNTGADNVGGPQRARATGRVARAIAAAHHSRFACGGALSHDVGYEGPVDTVIYGCWRRKTLLELGLFDEGLVRNQDDELNLRLTRRGGKIWQTPRIVSWYSPRPRLALLFKQYFQYGFWKVPVIRKHRIPASWRHLVPAAFVAANVILALAAVLEVSIGRTFWAAGLWAILVACYGACCIAAALLTGGTAGRDLLPVLPLVFATYHVSYGSGFFFGLFYWRKGSPEAVAPTGIFTEISR